MTSDNQRKRPRAPWIAVAALVLVLAGFAGAPRAEAADWTGGWDTVWRDGGAALHLEQTRTQVTGTYPVLDGEIVAEARGRLLVGTWTDASGSGSFVFAMAPDGQSFMGRFGNGEWWTGQRKQADEELQLVADATSPAASLRTLLVAGNLARSNRYDDLAAALAILDFSSLDEAVRDSPQERLELAGILFSVLDRTTMRLFDLPDPPPETGEVVVPLSQAGTGETVDLTFRYTVRPNGAAGWFIVVPPAEVMRADLERLGGLVPEGRRFARDYDALASPRDVMHAFLEGYHRWQETGDARLMLSALSLDALALAVRDEEGLRRAEYLKAVIDRIGYVLWQEIPDDPDRTVPYAYFIHPAGRIEIAPVEGADGEEIWRFTTDTVHSVRDLYVALEDMPVAPGLEAERTSQFLQLREFIRGIDRNLLATVFGVEIWQWAALALILVLAALNGWLITFLVVRVLLQWQREPGSALSIKNRFVRPIVAFVVGASLLASLRILGIPEHIDVLLRIAAGLLMSVTGGWIAYHFVDKLGRIAADPQGRFRTTDAMLRSVIVALAKVAVIIGSMLVLAEVLSIPYQGVIAGLGIGGLAVALAARSTLENFIGGLTLIADKPVRAGDFCRFGDTLGTVESLGLRSIKIRSLGRTVIVVPNGQFMNLEIENYTRRDNILLRTTLQLRYETTPEQMRWVLAEVRRLLLRHPRILMEPSRARFIGFGSSSQDVEIFAYIDTTDFNDFLAVQEDVFLRLSDIVAASGTSFAYPSTVNYLARDPGTDSDKTEKAENAVAAWRRNDRLPFPDFPNGERWEMFNTLDYPPSGSPDSASAAERRRAEESS